MKNILLITIDCLRKDYVTPELTPNIWKLKEEGLSFEDVITHSSHTSIAFLSMFASVTFDQIPEKSLPGILNKYGYTTIGITSQPQMYQRSLSKVREDFQFMNSLNPSAINLMGKIGLKGLAYKLRTQKLFPIYKLGQAVYRHFIELKKVIFQNENERESTWADARYLNECVHDLLKMHKIKEPFFLWVHYLDPHWRYYPPPEFLEGGITDVEIININKMYKDTPNYLTDKELEKIRNLYQGEVKYVDQKLGELLSFLKIEGLLSNTIKIVTADHGEEFLEHGGTQHSTQLYDEVVNVPFLIQGYGKKGKVKGQRGLINLAPTILEILGLPEEKCFRGKSMFNGENKDIVMKTFHGKLGTGFVSGKLGMRTEEWKYISSGELYNLKTDPGEKKNVAKENSNIVNMFENKLKGYRVDEGLEGIDLKKIEVEKRTELSEGEEELVKERLRSLGYLD
jgi:arylsulfatase A-like enzyme